MARTSTRTIVRYVPKKRRHSRSGGFKLPIAVVGGFMPMITDCITAYKLYGKWDGALAALGADTIGYNHQLQQWNVSRAAMKGWIPVMLGMLVHKYIGGRFGINRALDRAGVPIIRL